MFKISFMKCINCNEFYKPDKFFDKDIENMKKNNKLLYCKKCMLKHKMNYSVFQETLH